MKAKKVAKGTLTAKGKIGNQEKAKHPNMYRIITGVLVVLASALLCISLVFTSGAGPFGREVKYILLGFLGIVAYFFPIFIFYLGWIVLTRTNWEAYKVKLLCLLILLLLTACFFHIFTSIETYNQEASFINNLRSFYHNYEDQYLGGGVIGGLLTVPLIMVFGSLGTFIILTAAFIIALVVLNSATLKMLLVRAKNAVCSIGRSVKSSMVRKEVGKQNDKSSAESKKSEDIEINEPSIPEIFDFAEEKVIDFEKESLSRKKEKADLNASRLVKNKGTDKQAGHNQVQESTVEELKLDHTALKKMDDQYKFPPIEILRTSIEGIKTGSKKELHDVALKLEQTLASFGVNAKVINVSRGPTVTRYELSPGAGVKVSKIVGLADDLALNLAAPAVRIEAPIPGKAAVGIEIPNGELAPVYLRDIVESKEFRSFPSNLAFAIGKDIGGKIVIGDIAKMPHLLIAGATGSGKSVCINTLIASILYKTRPDQVKLLMIDPKVVELGVYNGIPHLLIPVVTDPKKAAGALNWAVQEMVSRYNLFADRGVRDIKGYNAILREEGSESILPQVVIIIDELADLMMVAPNDVEDAICRLAQMARAAGMHLVVATQRPSVDVITGVIKANIPSRISFAVSSQVDSRTILDMAGAEKLLGKGDMLYYPVGEPKPIRLQGTLVFDKEVEAIVDFVKGQAQVSYNEDIIEKLESESGRSEADPGDNDVLLPQVIDMIVETGQASISVIQRRFKVGYARAARLIDQAEARGIIGGFEGSKPRRVLVSKQQWEEMKAE